MIKVGEKMPEGILRTKTATIHELNASQIFSKKKIVLFALPGAFTPTCSAKHLPGYIKFYDDIKRKNIDDIICFAVNDPHVMKAWAEKNNVFGKIKMISDSDASYSKKLGLEHFYPIMGLRSLRFCMIIDNLVIKNLFVENVGEFKVSGAENIIQFL